jgi:hypothetical protein
VSAKKCHVSAKNHLRPPAPNRKYPLTEAADTLQRGAGRAKRNGRRKKTEVRQAGRAKKFRAHLSLFCLTLFEIAGI